MNLDLISLLTGLATGSLLAGIILYLAGRSSRNELVTQLTLETEKHRATGEMLYKTQESLVEKTRLLGDLNDEAIMNKARLENAAKTFSQMEEQLTGLKSETALKLAELNQKNEELTQLKVRNHALEEQLKVLKQEIDNTRKTFESEFKNLAQQILDEKTQKFTELNRTNLDIILKPLSDNIESFKKKVEDTYNKESQERFSLGEKVKELMDLNLKVSQEASNLTNALKGEVKKQGNWGEMVLERILEKSGLPKGVAYTIQPTYKDDHGNTLRPDVVLSYPDNRTVVIDSKVSLTAYEKYANEPDRELQQKYLKEHIQSIRNHIAGLSSKNYSELVESLDFTMMFIPIEPAYLEAVKEDEDLWHYAYNKRIILISPTHLISALKMIADLWKREFQNRNAEEIARRGGLLYDKFAGFVENLSKVGKNIEQAKSAYDDAFNQLSTGRGNLLHQADNLRKLGIKNTRELQSKGEETTDET